MMLSLSTEYYQILLSRGICIGVASGILYVPSLTFVTGSFKIKRALAVTLVTAGSSVGGIVYPLAFRYMLRPLGCGWTVRVIGFVASGITAIAIPMVRSSQSSKKSKLRSLFDIGAFKEPAYLVYNAGGFLKFLGFYNSFVYIPTYAEAHLNVSKEQSLELLAYVNAPSLIGRLLAAWIAYKIGVMAPWTACAVISGILCLTWLAVENIARMVTFAVLYGFISGALIGLPSAVLPYVAPLNVLGARMGMTWALAGIVLLIGCPIAGSLANVVDGNFIRLQLFCGMTLLAGATLQIPLWWMIRDKIAMAKAANNR